MPTSKAKRETFLIYGIFSLALSLRLGYLWFLQNNYFFYHYPSDDVVFYQTWADQIRQGGWLGQNAFDGMPLYPYFLAVLKGLTLNHELLIRLAHITLGSLNCVLVYLLTKKILSKNTAILAAIFAAADFTLIYYDWLMMPVTLIIFLSLIILIGLADYTEKTGLQKWLTLGIFIGLGTLGDGKFLIFLVLLFFYFLWRYRLQVQPLTKTLLPLFLGAMIVLLGTGVRNWAVSGNFVLLSTHGGINFYIGNNPRATGFFENPEFLRPTHEGHVADQQILAERALNKRLSPREVSGYWSEKALKFILGSPKKFLTLLSQKFWNFWRDTEYACDIDLLFQRGWKSTFDKNPLWAIVPLALLGAAVGWQKNSNMVPLSLLILSQLVFTLLFFLINRHRATVLPLFIILEASFLIWAFEQIKVRNFTAISVSLALICVLLWVLRPQQIKGQTLEFLRATKTGFVFADQGKYAKARDEYFRALKLRPFDSNTLYNLANVYFAEGNFIKAIEVYETGAKVDPLNTDILYNLAFCYEQTASFDRAKSGYERVINLAPHSLDARLRLANILHREGSCKQAIRQYQAIEKAAPQLKNQLDALINSCAPSS